MEWKVLDTGKASPLENMSVDARLLAELEHTHQPLLHFYDWEVPSATYGHFVDPYDYLEKSGVEKHGIALAKRPTGGGIIFHLNDFAFSAFVPANHPSFSLNTLENYAFINRIVMNVIAAFLQTTPQLSLKPEEGEPLDSSSRHFCMAKPTIYDVMIEGKKIAGGAQRRTRHGYLHQGTLSLFPLEEELLQTVLKSETRVVEAMRKNSRYLLEGIPSVAELLRARQRLKELFIAKSRSTNLL